MSILDRKSFLKILIISCFALVTSNQPSYSVLAASQKISIQSVSLSADQFISAQGLQRGGTVLYVSGSGFNANGKGINVYFGPYECNVIPQESTPTMIACKTSPMLEAKERSNLPITVYMVNSLPSSCYTSKCLFSYLNTLTTQGSSQEFRILAEGSPILKITCTGVADYDNGGSECASCDGLENSPGTATTSHKACNCNPTFVWNATSNTCECPKNSILIQAKCYPCGPLKSKYGTGLSTAEGICQCNPTFTFNSDSFTCVCSETNTFINSSGLCFSCVDKTTNGTGNVNSSAKACECKSTFIWNAKLNDCACPSDAVLDPTGACFSCSKLKAKNGTGALLTNNTCKCNPSFIFNADSNTCTCPDANSFIDKTSGQCFSCSNIGNSSNIANVTFRICNCNTNYVWNPTKNKTACLCPDKSIILSNDTCFQCSTLKGKNGTGQVNSTDKTTCACLKGFVFKTQTNTCECPDPISYIDKTTGLCVPCSNISNGTGAADVKARKCVCIDNTYVWTPTLRTPACICPINSVILVNSNGTCYPCGPLKTKNGTGAANTTNSTICGCLKTFVFNAETGACQCPESNSYVDKKLGCLSCANVGNSTGTANTTSKSCICSPSYIWNPSISSTACLCPPNSFILESNNSCFSCANFKSRNGTGLVNKTDGKSCQCVKNFIFNPETNACECPDAKSYIDKKTGFCVPCNSVGNSTGEINITSNTCLCLPGFFWTPGQSKANCLCPFGFYFTESPNTCVSCIVVKLRNGTGLVNKTDSKACQCLKTYVYSAETNSCSCPGTNSYVDPTTKLCVVCNASGNLTGDVDLAGKKCVCIDSTYIWSPKLKVPNCICPANSIIASNGSCFSCFVNKAKNLTGLVNIANISACACLKSFVWNSDTLACECPDPNSYIDKVTGLCIACPVSINSTGVPDVANRKCTCKDSSYVWVPTFKTPGCYCLPNSIVALSGSCFLCTTLKGKNGTGAVNSTNNALCACLRSFVFNAETLVCQCPDSANSYVDKATGQCISCSQIGNSSNVTTGTGCTCLDTFVWDATKSKTSCLCPTLAILANDVCFLCSTLSAPNATGKVNSTNKSACECVRSYIFDTETNTCHCPDQDVSFISVTKLCVSCKNVQYSPGTLNGTNACSCNDNFVYSTSLNKCLCSSPNKIVNGECTLPTPKASTAGNCPNGMQWDSNINGCVCSDGSANINSNCVSCSSIANSNGQTGSDKVSCQCQSGFIWNATQSSCTSA